jgi:hypothetical protein
MMNVCVRNVSRRKVVGMPTDDTSEIVPPCPNCKGMSLLTPRWSCRPAQGRLSRNFSFDNPVTSR